MGDDLVSEAEPMVNGHLGFGIVVSVIAHVFARVQIARHVTGNAW